MTSSAETVSELRKRLRAQHGLASTYYVEGETRQRFLPAAVLRRRERAALAGDVLPRWKSAKTAAPSSAETAAPKTTTGARLRAEAARQGSASKERPVPPPPAPTAPKPERERETPTSNASSNGASNGGGGLSAALNSLERELLALRSKPSVDAARVAEIVDERIKAALAAQQPMAHVWLDTAGVERASIDGHAHAKLPEIVELVALGDPVLLVGPTGNGKSTAARMAADVLRRECVTVSMSGGMSEGQLLGYRYPGPGNVGMICPDTPLVDAVRHGKILIIEEVDSADPNALICLHDLMEATTDSIRIPSTGERVPKAKGFGLILTANTTGTGATREYVGRNELDGATLDRVALTTLEMGYDEALEVALCDPAVLAWGHAIRAAIVKHGLRRRISTRTLERATKHMRQGIKLQTLAERFLSGWTEAERSRLPNGGLPA